MASTGLSFFILGVLVALVRADNSTLPKNSSMAENMTETPNQDMNSSSTTAEGQGNRTTIGPITTTMLLSTTFTTNKPSTTTASNRKEGVLTKGPEEPKEPASHSEDSTGIIILVVIILVALGFGVACYCARKRGRRYSMDLNSRADGANIPLSTVEPEMTAEAGAQNGLKTFENANASTKDAVTEAKAEEQVEEKGEADPSAESAAPAKPPDSAEVDSKGDVTEPTPPASVHVSVEEITQEGLDSNKTSVESLRDANENNSNNGGRRQQRDLFWDIPLSDSV